MRKEFTILSINISAKKGMQKKPVSRAVLKKEHGITGDAHTGTWHRQVSLLAAEDVASMRGKGIDIGYGDFAENITTQGIELAGLPVGSRLHLGDAVLEITQIGKQCHHGCEIYRIVGDCVMPRKGVFTRVVRGGEISCESNCYYDFR